MSRILVWPCSWQFMHKLGISVNRLSADTSSNNNSFCAPSCCFAISDSLIFDVRATLTALCAFAVVLSFFSLAPLPFFFCPVGAFVLKSQQWTTVLLKHFFGSGSFGKMYNGIGLTTARGSGTNGYVQRNMAFVKDRPRQQYNTERTQPVQKKPNEEILEHERKRQLEVKVLEWAASTGILDKGYVLHTEL